MNLVLSLSSLGYGDWSPPGPHLELVNAVANCASPGPCDSGPTWTSPGSGGSGSHMGLSWTWFLWSPSGLTFNNMTMIHIWASPGPGDTRPYLVIWSPLGLHLVLVNLVLSWSSHGSGDWSPPGPHLDLVNPVASCGSPGPCDCGPTWASPGRGDWFPQGTHLDLVNLLLTWASWELVTQFHIGASSGPRDSRPPLGLTLTW